MAYTRTEYRHEGHSERVDMADKVTVCRQAWRTQGQSTVRQGGHSNRVKTDIRDTVTEYRQTWRTQ